MVLYFSKEKTNNSQSKVSTNIAPDLSAMLDFEHF
jgi:hypothetical protein